MVKELWHISKEKSLWKTTSSNSSFESICSMISTGTERLIATGMVDHHFQKQMSVPYMDGNFDLPIKYGYSLIVMDEQKRIGHLMHPHQSHVEVEADKIFWTKEDITPHRLSLISNMETVINAIWDSEASANDKVAICGFGNIGSLLANTLKVHYDIDPVIFEQDEWRMQKAQALGFSMASGDDYDTIYHTTSTEAGLQWCINNAATEANIIELSWYGNKRVNLELGRAFHYKRLNIKSSQVSLIPKHKKEETYLSRKNLALKLLKHESFDRLITNVLSIDEVPHFFEKLRVHQQEPGLIYIIDYLKATN